MALLSAVLLYFTVSLHPVWWVAWIAPLPLLYGAFQTTRREAGWLAFGAAALGYCSNAHYYWVTADRSVLVAVLLIVLQAFAWYGVVRFAHRAVTRERRWYSVLAYPVAWAALDTIIGFASPHGSAGSLAYSQGDFLPVLQITSVAGLPGVVFLIGLPASVIAVLLQYRDVSWRTWAPAVAMFAIALTWGALRVSRGDARTLGTVRVGLASIDDFVSRRVPQAEADRVWNRYLQMVEELAQQKAQLILLPEKIEDFKTPERAQEKLAALGEAARRHHVYVAAGMSVPKDGRMYNRLMIWNPEGSELGSYDKMHLVPGLESYLTPGVTAKTARVENASYGLGICKDFHFPSFGRMYSLEGVDAVLDPAWDFGEDAWIAARLSAVRGIEGGFSMVRSSREGLMTVTDRFGRIAGETWSKPGNGSTLLVDFAMAPANPTFYGRYGDVFGWLMVAAAIALRFWA